MPQVMIPLRDERTKNIRPLQSLILKPIGSFCNLACDYCFYLDKHHLYEGFPSTHRMSDEVLEKLIVDMFVCSDNPTFVWHGGEPTVLGLDFFKKVVTLQKKHCFRNKTYANAIQTHGLLLNEAWADFLKRENFLVGISLDGPEELHDRYRKDRQGHGTFQQAFSHAKMLLRKGVHVNILVTVNDYSVKYPLKIYNFFIKHGFMFMQFSPVVELDKHNANIAAPYSVNAQAYGRFLDQLFQRWLKDFNWKRLKQKTSIRFFDSLLQIYIGQTPDHCVLHKTCNDYLVAEHNGDLFSCDFLVGKDTYLGNALAMPLAQAFNSEAHIAFGQRKAAYGEQCQQCQWLRMCHGGCIKDRLHDPQDHGHNHFCESHQYFFERADKHFDKLKALYQQHYQK